MHTHQVCSSRAHVGIVLAARPPSGCFTCTALCARVGFSKAAGCLLSTMHSRYCRSAVLLPSSLLRLSAAAFVCCFFVCPVCLSAVCDGLPPAELLKGLGTWSESCKDKTYWGSVCTGTCREFGTASIKCGGYEWMLDTFKGGCSSSAGAAVCWVESVTGRGALLGRAEGCGQT